MKRAFGGEAGSVDAVVAAEAWIREETLLRN